MAGALCGDLSPPPSSSGNSSSTLKSFLAILALAVMVLAVYWQVGDHSFIHYDDEKYVTKNPIVQRGLTGQGVAWAFTTIYASNWHPLTWLSHMADVELFGLDAGWHHRVNVLLHALNSVLLFVMLNRMTGSYWRSGVVAALFAVHPLHVESVAWVAERKDVLSTFFLLMTINLYVSYVRRPAVVRYVAVASSLALGLMAKPMLVTLPFVLLLLDYWPLGRFASAGSGGAAAPPPSPPVPPTRLILEKLPLIGLSLISSVITYLAQESGHSMTLMGDIPAGTRIANALLSYVNYLGKMVWPSSLSVIYPHPAYLRGIAPWETALSAGFLLSVTVWAVGQATRRPYLAVGWFWYLGTLIPVIGLVQVGVQAMADRYTYVPLVGVFISLVWWVSDLVPGSPFSRRLLAPAAVGAVAVLGWLSWQQAAYWKNDVALFSHALEANPGNQEARNNLGIAHNNMGMDLLTRGNVREAARHFREASKASPLNVTVLLNLGVSEASLGNSDEAIRLYREVLEIDPKEDRARYNLDLVLAEKRRHAK